MAKVEQIKDASENVAINPVVTLDGRTVAWAVAFPRDFEVQFEGTQPEYEVAA